ncbi:MAG TPA: malto-oligosyltrehalose synthase [Streptosporangiaceae bacterium]|jgi:(1->4)-alpha-D-glucan 1-alpha-D-glucosylmutase|nr:malto-oligosyltrehalose synthase [Streptosporangiaceae bacterium]
MATTSPALHPRPRAATYRVQLHAGFTFDDAARIAGYLAALGVSHLYCSPYLQAAKGSTHGYDVVDPGHLNAELGGEAGHRELREQLDRAGLGQVLDIVPNHMALDGRNNAWWWDVLENGPSSVYASYFDIDWDPPQRKLAATVLMPVLGDQYGRVLEAGELVVRRQGGSFTVRYHDHEAPISPRTLGDLLASAAARSGSEELASLALAFSRLPHARRTDRAAVTERHRDKEVLRARLADLTAARPAVAAAIDAEVEALNRDPDALDDLLSQQNYRLAYWRTGAEELSYRRFFDIETLAGLRVEDPAVFADTHRLILALVADGTLDGLRVDHVDGLADPEGYLVRLRDATGGVYVVVEKILEASEELPQSWPVAGTSGYEFLNHVNQLFTDSRHEAAMRACYAAFTGEEQDYADVVYAAKLQIMRDELGAEMERLAGLLADVCEQHRRQRDHTRRELREALRELLAAFGVYRTYFRAGHPATAADRAHVAAAVVTARQRRPDLDIELISFIGDLLTGAYPGAEEASFAVRFAQVSAPVMAKGVEDTAFYRYLPLVSLNEVGGDPGRFGRPVADFHHAMASAARHWPEAMLTLSTHDTKRSGDVRARLSLLSELPGEWERAVAGWADGNERHKRDGWPDRNAEYLLYQTLVGAWPIDVGRASAFMLKAAKEAKVHTSWTDPNARYDDALSAFVTAVLADRGFVAGLEEFLATRRLVELGRVTSLAQTALLLTCPGIPDLYQGTELWDLSLVDPDNRRPVDYERRRELLEHLAGAGPEEALARADEGGPKQWLIHRVLGHRRRHPGAYRPGSGYEPLHAHGHLARHVVAFARSGGLAVVVPRLVARLDTGWPGTVVDLPDGDWRDILTGDPVPGGPAPVATLLRRFPVAVLGRDG